MINIGGAAFVGIVDMRELFMTGDLLLSYVI
jgi:hypothetical protein